jgi:hypothetical protein
VADIQRQKGSPPPNSNSISSKPKKIELISIQEKQKPSMLKSAVQQQQKKDLDISLRYMKKQRHIQ